MDCKYVFDEDMRKLKVLSKNELIKKLNKYSYKKHNIHSLPEKDVMKIRDKVLKIV